MRANGIEVELGADQKLHVVGTDLVIDNPLVGKGLELDLGQLWLSIWAEDQHNKLDSTRLRALLLNAAQASVGKLITLLKEDV
jgi:hypothetical protein